MSERWPLPLVAYRIATTLAAPAAPALLRWRAGRGKEDPSRLAERWGEPSQARPAGELVWAHGASIGETLSLLPVVQALVDRGLAVVATSGTRTAATILAARLPAGACHQHVPLDAPPFVRRFLDHWRPALAVFAESEIWPNIILELERRGVPLALVNARMSARSERGWERAPKLARALLGRLALCCPQGDEDGRRFARFGATVTQPTGSLKFDVAPPAADPAAVERLAGLAAGRPIWMAASTHPGEDEIVVATHLALARDWPRLLTIVAPRHPARAHEIAGYAASAGLTVERRSEGDAFGGADLHIVDTVGDLGLFFRLAPIVFMGGSLVEHGGQNPIEPIRLGAAILHGPHTANFAAIYDALDRDGGSRLVADADGLAGALGAWLGRPALVRAAARAGSATVATFGGALARTLDALEPLLPRGPAGFRPDGDRAP